MANATVEPTIPASQSDALFPQPAKQDPMSLHDFRDLIANMPVSLQAFTSKRSTWASHLFGEGPGSSALSVIFGNSDEVTLSRNDLRCLAKNKDLAQFLMATIVWGYPRGMRNLLFVGTEGQGVHEISNFTNAAVAAWIEPHQRELPTGPIAVLHNAVGNALPFSRAMVQLQPLLRLCSSQTPISFSIRSDAAGNLFPTSPIPACPYAAIIAIVNDGSHSSAIVKFKYAVY